MFCRIVQLVWFRYSMSSGQGAGFWFWLWDGMGWDGMDTQNCAACCNGFAAQGMKLGQGELVVIPLI